MLTLPEGQIYVNKVKLGNSICFTDNPTKEEIQKYFEMWKDAERLIYVNGDIKEIYSRN